MARPTWRILVAEPDDVNLQLIDMLLAEPGFELTLVASGAEALEHLKHNTPDLCLLAMDLPDVSGDDICYKIRRVTRLATIHVVLIAEQSGRFGLSDEVKRRSKRVGADMVLPRPLGDKNLKDRMKALLEERAEVPGPGPADDELMDVMEDALDAADELPDDLVVGRPGDVVSSSDEDLDASANAAAAGSDRVSTASAAADESALDDGATTPSDAVGGPPPNPPQDAPQASGPTHARHGPQAEMTPTQLPGSDTTDPDTAAKLAKLRKEREILKIENAQLKRKLKEKQDVIDRGVNMELEDRVKELERRNAALLEELEKRDDASGGRRGRRR